MRTFVSVVAIVACVIPALAADPPKGVEPGQVLPGPFNAFVVFGGPKPPPPQGEPTQTTERLNFGDPSRANKFHDLITRFNLDPTVALFIREAPPAEDQPLVKLIKSLDDTVQKNRNSRLHAFGIFLRLNNEFLKDDTRIPQMNQIKEFGTRLELKEFPLAIDQVESDRTKAFKIAADDQVTILIYENLKVRDRFVFTSEKPLDEAAAAKVLESVKAMIKK
ncbi:MAG: hypothetical protein ACJ8C4_13760 [Gemmataceae bacterium]